jgi:hypothetical protein
MMDTILNRFVFALLSALCYGLLSSVMRIPLIYLPSNDCAPNKMGCRMASFPYILTCDLTWKRVIYWTVLIHGLRPPFGKVDPAIGMFPS